MKKISTLFKKDPNNLSRVINEIDPQNEWIFDKGVLATQKYDGAAAAVINGVLYKRYDVKNGREVPQNSIPCQEPDLITGHWPHWVPCDRNKPEDKYFFEAFGLGRFIDGTYELCGEKINGNKQGIKGHILFEHGSSVFVGVKINFDSIEYFLKNVHVEGIVFHHPDGRMCKIRKKDFGLKW